MPRGDPNDELHLLLTPAAALATPAARREAVDAAAAFIEAKMYGRPAGAGGALGGGGAYPMAYNSAPPPAAAYNSAPLPPLVRRRRRRRPPYHRRSPNLLRLWFGCPSAHRWETPPRAFSAPGGDGLSSVILSNVVPGVCR
jgi:hypothetical protein